MVESEQVSHDPQVFGQCPDTPSSTHLKLERRATHSHDLERSLPLYITLNVNDESRHVGVGEGGVGDNVTAAAVGDDVESESATSVSGS